MKRKCLILYEDQCLKNVDSDYPTRHKGIDIALIRENTEGEYSGLEHSVFILFGWW